jgi:hypothetical protein
VVAHQRHGVTHEACVEVGERIRQVVHRAAEHAHVVGVTQVGGQGGLGRLLLEVSAEVCAAQAPAQPLLLAAEEVLNRVVGARDDGHDRAGLSTAGRMAEQQGAVALDSVLRSEP